MLYSPPITQLKARTGATSGSEVLVTGASGFVGRRLAPALVAADFRVRCLSRNAALAAQRWPEQHWVQADPRHEEDLARALDGCQVAYFLVHSLGEGSAGLLEREHTQVE